MKKQRKLAFYEIGKSGNYASLMQREFEQAQRICLDTNKPVTVVSRITLLIDRPIHGSTKPTRRNREL